MCKKGPNWRFSPNSSWVGLALGYYYVRRLHVLLAQPSFMSPRHSPTLFSEGKCFEEVITVWWKLGQVGNTAALAKDSGCDGGGPVFFF